MGARVARYAGEAAQENLSAKHFSVPAKPIQFSNSAAVRILALQSRAIGKCPPEEFEGGADAGNFRSRHGRLHEGKKCRRMIVTATARRTPAPARGGLRPIRAAPGGLTKLSTAGGLSRLRRCALARARTKPPEESPCDERQARRNHRDFSRCERSALRFLSQPPLPIRAPNTPRDAPLVNQDVRIIRAPRRAGINFSALMRERVENKGNMPVREKLYPHIGPDGRYDPSRQRHCSVVLEFPNKP